MKRPGSLVIIGSGPLIGSHVAAQFASKGFTKIALIARRLEQLEKDKQLVLSSPDAENATVKTYSADITDTETYTAILSQITADLGAPECVFFNAALVRASKLLDVSDEDLIYDYKIQIVALHNTAKWAIPQLLTLAKNPDAKPSFLITNSLLPQQPNLDCISLSLVKAAQANLAQSFALKYGKEGIHTALVVVGGVVAHENKLLNPRNIADKTWALFDQPRDLQTFTTEILE